MLYKGKKFYQITRNDAVSSHLALANTLSPLALALNPYLHWICPIHLSQCSVIASSSHHPIWHTISKQQKLGYVTLWKQTTGRPVHVPTLNTHIQAHAAQTLLSTFISYSARIHPDNTGIIRIMHILSCKHRKPQL